MPANAPFIATPGKLLERMRKYCAYQERSHHQVRQRLFELGSEPEWVDGLVLALMEEGFLNEERFARAYAKGKFNQNHWGRKLIRKGLAEHGIKGNLLLMALTEIDDDAYLITLNRLTSKKWHEVKDRNPIAKKTKVIRFLLSKGYESDLVFEAVKACSE